MATSPSSVAQDNAATARALYDIYNTRAFDRMSSVVAESVEITMVPFGFTFHGVDGARNFHMGWATAFPDSKVEIRSVTMDGDRVYVEHIGRGTHTGPFVTPAGTIAATGRRVEVPLCDAYELADGKITRARSYFDAATLMSQLGVNAPAGSEAESANVALARRWFDAMNAGDLDTVAAIFAPTYRLHYPDIDSGLVGPEVIRGLVAAYRDAFPDLRFDVDDTVSSGEMVLVRWTASGTNRGALLGAPATGRFARWTGTSLLRVSDGRIVEDWVENDRLGMLQQLGLAPAPEAPAAV